ncbi:MAG: hypothetical protein R6U55_14665 [Desulfovermiculus sp.]
MHKDLFLATIFCCLAACAPLEKDAGGPNQSLHTTTWQESATVEVSLDSQETQAGEDPEELLQERGLLQGVRKSLNTWLNQRLLFKEQRVDLAEENSTPFVRLANGGQAVHTRETDMYTQTFKIQSIFKPKASEQGEITDLENQRTIVASHDQVLIQGQEWTSQAEDAFFVVARPAHEVDGEALRMIGYGRIYHVQDWMAQGRLLEANLEIMAGDSVYPIWVSSQTVEVSQAPTEIEDSGEEVVVEPQPRSGQEASVQERPMPAETK